MGGLWWKLIVQKFTILLEPRIFEFLINFYFQNGNGTHHHQGRHIDAKYTAFTCEWNCLLWKNQFSKILFVTSDGNGHKAPEPTVAIISCLFLEKQAVDAIIEDSKTIHKYKVRFLNFIFEILIFLK